MALLLDEVKQPITSTEANAIIAHLKLFYITHVGGRLVVDTPDT